MKIHRFYYKNLFKTKSPNQDILTINANDDDEAKSLIHQWFNVLKLRDKENIILFNGDNINYNFIILTINKNSCSLKLTEQKENIICSQQKLSFINLCLPLIKKENLYLTLQKCSEMGILKFIPIISDRTENKNIETFVKDIEKGRIETILKESIEQSGQNYLPQIQTKIKIKDILEQLLKSKDFRTNPNSKVFILDFNGNNVKNFIKQEEAIYLFVGPEGGWSENEKKYFYNLQQNTENKVFIISTSQSILRSETACINICSIFSML